MGNLLIFCLIIGLCGAFVGVLFDFRTIGLTLCVIANCLLHGRGCMNNARGEIC